MADQIVKSYPCSQKDLYSVCNTMWDNYPTIQVTMATYKAKYIAGLKATMKLQVKAARDMPDQQAREGAAEELRLQMLPLAKVCLNDFQLLKGYIDDAFTGVNEPLRKPNYEEAGQLKFRDASNQDWESQMGLNTSMTNYMIAKLAVLTAGANMPVGFPAAVAADILAWELKYEAFKVAEQTQVETDLKIKANNDVYNLAIDLGNDVKRKFYTNQAVMDKFTFDTLLALINPPVSGVKGSAVMTGTNEEVEGVLFKAQKTGSGIIEFLSDEDGEYFKDLSEGDWTIEGSKTGLVTQTKTVTLTGTFKTLDWVFVAV